MLKVDGKREQEKEMAREIERERGRGRGKEDVSAELGNYEHGGFLNG